MSDSFPTPESSVFLPSPEATVKVHNAMLFGEDLLWGAHIVFAVFALLGVMLIVMGRGPRRADAHVAAVKDGSPQLLSSPEQA